MFYKKFLVILVLSFQLCILPFSNLSANEDRAELWVNLYTGEPTTFDEMLEDLISVDVIYLGERHTIDRHHKIQLQTVDAFYLKGIPIVIGLEMMEKKFQPELDRYADGEISFEELVEITDWDKNWKNNKDYKQILELGRKAKAKILALNAEAATIRKIGREGLDSLREDERNSLAEEINLDDPEYLSLLKMQLMVHATMSEDVLDRIFAAQVARDDTMAEVLADFLKSPEGEGRKAIVLTGSGHCNYGYGMVSRVKSRIAEINERILIMSESGDVVIPPEMMKYVRDIEITHQQLRNIIKRPLADYLSIKESRQEEQ